MKKLIMIFCLSLLFLSVGQSAVCHLEGGKYLYGEEKYTHRDYEEIVERNKQIVKTASKYNDWKPEDPHMSIEKNKAISLPCDGSDTSKHNRHRVVAQKYKTNNGFKIVVIKNGKVIDVFNGYNKFDLYYGTLVSGMNWLTVRPNISNDGRHIIYLIQASSSDIWFEELYEDHLFNYYINNTKLVDYKQGSNLLEDNNLEYKFSSNKYFPNEKHVERTSDDEGNTKFKEKGKYRYELSNEQMDQIDEVLNQIHPDNYDKFIDYFEGKFEKYKNLGEEMTYEEYKLQVVYYYIFSELKIKSLKLDGEHRF